MLPIVLSVSSMSFAISIFIKSGSYERDSRFLFVKWVERRLYSVTGEIRDFLCEAYLKLILNFKLEICHKKV